jgi:hypothetical protein
VALPKSEFLDQAHIVTICTRAQFAASECPRGAIYGRATVTTPLFDEPLTGPVYLRSSSNLLPDLVPDLRGPDNLPIKIEAAGRIDEVGGGIRNTFDFVPDRVVARSIAGPRYKESPVNAGSAAKSFETKSRSSQLTRRWPPSSAAAA